MKRPSMLTADRPPGVNWRYDRAEILADGLVHAVGLVMGVAGAAALLYHAKQRSFDAAPLWVYSTALLAMLGCSAAYNLWPLSPAKWILRRFDHAAIYFLIAATYTPFLARVEDGLIAGILFPGIWIVALLGILLKLLLPGRFDRLSIALCLLLSWSGIVAYKAVVAVVPGASLWLLLTGGIAYSVGVVFHLWESLRFQNAIWHVFVILGAAFHYAAVIRVVFET